MSTVDRDADEQRVAVEIPAIAAVVATGPLRFTLKHLLEEAVTQNEAEEKIYSAILSASRQHAEIVSKQIEVVSAYLASVGKPEERKKAREAAAEVWKHRKAPKHRTCNRMKGTR